MPACCFDCMLKICGVNYCVERELQMKSYNSIRCMLLNHPLSMDYYLNEELIHHFASISGYMLRMIEYL